MEDPRSTNPSDVRRIVILDPGLRSLLGHHVNYARAMMHAAAPRNVDTVIFCSNRAPPELVAELPAIPHFSVETYDKPPISPSRPDSDYESWVVQGSQLLVLNMHFLSNLFGVSAQIGPGDHIFFNSVLPNQLLAICQWLSAFPEETRPPSTIVLRYWEHTRFWRPAFELCASILNRSEMRCRVCSDTVELAVLYADMMGRPVDRLPIPHMPPAIDPAAPRRHFRPEGLPPGTVTVGYLGETRVEKGAGFLTSVVEELTRRGAPSFHLLMQVSAPWGLPPDVIGELQKLVAMTGDKVTLLMEILSTEDYYALLQDSDIVLINYDPERYRHSSSGIFTEAIAAGKVVVIPADTSIEREAQRFDMGYTGIARFDAMSVAEALYRALSDYPALADRSRRGKAAVEAYHNPDNLMAHLLGEL